MSGVRSNGEPFAGTVEVPEAFPYLMMKLHAFADRKADVKKGLGSHHALDAYTIVGMMTEVEYERALHIAAANAANLNVDCSRRIVASDFAEKSSLGLLRIQEHPLYSSDFELDRFRAVLKEIFPAS